MQQSKDSTTLKMNKFPNLKKPSHLLATLFGVGKLPYGPGTWGSLATLIVWYFCNDGYLAMVICIKNIFQPITLDPGNGSILYGCLLHVGRSLFDPDGIQCANGFTLWRVG